MSNGICPYCGEETTNAITRDGTYVRRLLEGKDEAIEALTAERDGMRAVVETITAAAEYQHADILTERSWDLDNSLPFTLTVGEIRALAAAKAASESR